MKADRKSFAVLLALVCLAGLAVACDQQAGPAGKTPAVAETAVPTATVPAATAPASQSLPPEPRPVTFETSGGKKLDGRYFPAAVDNAPVVVLMHWAGGNQFDWDAIAPWLQNRGVVYAGGSSTWLDPTWFPEVPAGRSYAVFTFTTDSFGPQPVLDAEAAIRTARSLEGVDPERVATVGASIGADAAVDACGEGCVGAFSLSPGSFLGKDYAAEVSRLGSLTPPVPVVCLASEADGPSKFTCQSAEGAHYSPRIYAGGEHGMTLIKPELDPQPLNLLLEFLARVFGE